MNEIVGGGALILGVAFVLICLYAAWRESRQPATTATARGAEAIDLPKLIEAVTKLIEALTKAQFWLAATLVGLFLIGYGSWVLATDPF